MNVCIAVPAYGYLVQTLCLESIVRTQAALLSKGIGCDFRTISVSDVAAARNILATQFIEDGTCSHLLFVDADMAFAPKTVLKMLGMRKGVIGCAYPAKSLDLASLIRRAREHPKDDPHRVVASVQHYVIKHLPGKTKIVKGLCRVAGIGMGLCLIEARAFATIEESGSISRSIGTPLWKREGTDGPLLGFFDPLPRGRGYMSEDFSFCERWTRCGGEIFALVTEDVAHIGRSIYGGPYMDRLLASGLRNSRIAKSST
jgi:hypothetical protein